MDVSKVLGVINKTFDFKIRNLLISPTYWQAGAIVFLLFLLVWTLARLRHMYVGWSLGKSSIAFIFWGFLLALTLEGFLIISGKTMLTEILGWKNVPKPISTALDISREKLVNVLGDTDEIPKSSASEAPTSSKVILDFQNLSDMEAQEVRLLICEP